MRRIALVLLTGSSLLIGSGCRHSCGERHGLFGLRRDPDDRLLSRHHDDCNNCRDGTTVGRTGNVVPVSGGTWTGEPYPIYPGGVGSPAPANELPAPRITPPGVPEGPATPSPAIPAAGTLPAPSGRTTGDGKK